MHLVDMLFYCESEICVRVSESGSTTFSGEGGLNHLFQSFMADLSCHPKTHSEVELFTDILSLVVGSLFERSCDFSTRPELLGSLRPGL